jgi:hypothetical protein
MPNNPIQLKIGSDLIMGSLKAGVQGSIGTQDMTLTYDPIILQYDKYFPYANSAGDPIYNESTGEELVDPLS